METGNEVMTDAVYLNEYKAAMHERSERAGMLQLVGPMAQPENQENWNHAATAISLQRRVESNEVDSNLFDKALKVASQSYVKCTRNVGARLRCIDGRKLLGYDDNNINDLSRDLGPQIPGGTPIEAVAYRIAVGYPADPTTKVDIKSDMNLVADKDTDIGFLPADHIDDHAEPSPKRTGCRAVDGVEEHAEALEDVAKLSQVKHYLKMMLGDSFNANHFEQSAESAKQIIETGDDYFFSKDEILKELLQLNPDGAPVLTGSHKEIFIVVNMVEEDVFHRDHFSAQFGDDGQNIQAFNYDAWYTLKAAEALFPDDTDLQSRYIHTCFALAITALMDLTDGSLPLVVRQPRDAVLATAA